jgi:hypothetical protein
MSAHSRQRIALCLCGVTLLALALSPTLVSSCWNLLSQSSIASAAPIIVSGEIIKIDVAKDQFVQHKTARFLDVAHIRIDKVYKNVLTDVNVAPLGQITALMHSSDYSVPGSEQPNGTKLSVLTSTDITYKKGTKAVWFLFLHKDGKFYINDHPQQCVRPDLDKQPNQPVPLGFVGPTWTKAAWASEDRSQMNGKSSAGKTGEAKK